MRKLISIVEATQSVVLDYSSLSTSIVPISCMPLSSVFVPVTSSSILGTLFKGQMAAEVRRETASVKDKGSGPEELRFSHHFSTHVRLVPRYLHSFQNREEPSQFLRAGPEGRARTRTHV